MRDAARKTLGFEKSETAISGTGQTTTFRMLGFTGSNSNLKPDGWYLPKSPIFPAIALETKAGDTTLTSRDINQILKYGKVLEQKYKNWIGILYNGEDIQVYKNGELLEDEKVLHNKEHYLGLFEENRIDSQRIYNITKRINNLLHFEFGVKNLKHRMIFTACALVAKRYGAIFHPDMSFNVFTASIIDTLKKSYENELRQNTKLGLLLETYNSIQVNTKENQKAIANFAALISEIADDLNSRYWRGEDVMAIFFNEFNSHKIKGEQGEGQVFTPDHITSLMYRILEVNKEDKVLDAACGSGSFLVKAMCNMIKEAGGPDTDKATEIKQNQLYGVEWDPEIYALACANMLIHKDGKTNLYQGDSRSPEVSKWIREKGITKVLMNPPFETRAGCVDIVLNVLNSVPKGALCGFILPDKKLEKKVKTKVERMLRRHTLQKIIKLPEETFPQNVSTSIFIFKAGFPQNDANVFACRIEKDGLVTVKNQGRQDLHNKWHDIEEHWVDVIRRQSSDIASDGIKWIKPSPECISYPIDEKQVVLRESDFAKTVLDYLMFEEGVDADELGKEFLERVMYSGVVDNSDAGIIIKPENNEHA